MTFELSLRYIAALCVAGFTLAAGPVSSPALAQEKLDPGPANAPLSAQAKGVATKAIEAAQGAAKTAGDILVRTPCLRPKGNAAGGSLPRVAGRIAHGEPVKIVALGSSSTEGYGVTSPSYTYPNRLAEQLRRKYPTAHITVVNLGKGGQEVPDMVARLDTVLAENPDLVIWQFGTNMVVRRHETGNVAAVVEDGVSRMQAAGADVVLVDPQYVPAVNANKEGASRMVKLISDVARLKRISVFPRFEVMRQWHEDDKMPFESFVIKDGLHMNDWGYACFAQLLGDTIIRSVGEVRAGVAVPSNVMTFRPM
ncbi:SGNH/GDSL hydrolase family protein [Afipia sp. Root123D2]|uniref:SGNH/GDSL hydrolase family protein n=1 Tax=Afipia sp. Root123D2 TaxID=1736436 RepID=UPI0009E7F1D4|nr:SGNH/GDSL hydrolase family protein [Afipia sp. Root123D2]